MNDKVFIGLDVSTGLGKGNGFIDMFAGLHFEGHSTMLERAQDIGPTNS